MRKTYCFKWYLGTACTEQCRIPRLFNVHKAHVWIAVVLLPQPDQDLVLEGLENRVQGIATGLYENMQFQMPTGRLRKLAIISVLQKHLLETQVSEDNAARARNGCPPKRKTVM